MTKNKSAFLKALSAVTGNLSAAWFALVLVTPNFTSISSIKAIVALTLNIILAILFLVITAIIERTLQNE